MNPGGPAGAGAGPLSMSYDISTNSNNQNAGSVQSIHSHITLCMTVFNFLTVQPQGSQQMNPGQMLEIAGGRGDARKSLDFKQSKQQ